MLNQRAFFRLLSIPVCVACVACGVVEFLALQRSRLLRRVRAHDENHIAEVRRKA